jgi:arylsulfatase A-like enzyme
MTKENLKKKYNVIMITIDGARIDRIKNFENFNKIIKQGTFFSNVITYGPQTVTSLYSIFTGVYGNKTKANNYYGSIKFKKDCFKTLTQYFQEAGFYTKGDILNEIILPKQGFDDLKIHDEQKDDLTKRHIEMIKEVNELKKQGKNFFLYLHYSKIHTELIKNVIKKYTDFDEIYFNNLEQNIKNYDKYIQKADEYLGKLFETCKNLDLFNNTIFVIFSDHGVSVGEKKGEKGYGRYCYDYTLKTFISIIQPNIFPEIKIDKLSRTIDIMPTLLDVLNIQKDDNYEEIQGKSLIPLIDKEPDERISFSESAGVEEEPSNTEPSIKCVRTKDWKLIYNIETKKKELYNLIEDPNEKNNLVNKNSEVLNKLWDELKVQSQNIEK